METPTAKRETQLPKYASDVLLEDSRNRIKELEKTVEEIAQKLEHMYNQLQCHNQLDV